MGCSHFQRDLSRVYGHTELTPHPLFVLIEYGGFWQESPCVHDEHYIDGSLP